MLNARDWVLMSLAFLSPPQPSADVISTVEFNHTGELLATGDKGGRVVIFQREPEVRGTWAQGGWGGWGRGQGLEQEPEGHQAWSGELSLAGAPTFQLMGPSLEHLPGALFLNH